MTLPLSAARSKAADGDENENTGPQGFSRDLEIGATYDAADEDDELVDDDPKSEEPDDGEDLDERIDE